MLPNRIVPIVVLLVYHTRTTSPLWRPYYDRYPRTITDRVRYSRLAYVIQKYALSVTLISFCEYHTNVPGYHNRLCKPVTLVAPPYSVLSLSSLYCDGTSDRCPLTDRLVENYDTVSIDTSAEREKILRSPAVIDAIETMNEIERIGNRPTQTVCESSGIKDHECNGADLVYNQSSHQSDRIKNEDCEVQERADRRAKEMANTTIDEEMKKEEVSSAAIYYHDGGKLFAEDVF